jgi:uncharacterized protein involved in exopolysaccharide biosynthesis
LHSSFLLVMVTAGVTTYFLPREYFSKVTMEVKEDKSGPVEVFSAGARGHDPTFVPTHFQILQKPEILYPVIENLKLIDEWSTEGRKMPLQSVHMKLLKMINLREIRNTTLIEIGVYSTNAQEAANIANTIAVVYREKRLNVLTGAIEAQLRQLTDQVETQRKLVEKAKNEVDKIRVDDEIIDSDPESFNSTPTTADRNIVELEKQVNEQSAIVTKIKQQLEAIMKMQPTS